MAGHQLSQAEADALIAMEKHRLSDEVRKLIDEYVGWLREKTTLRQVGEWVEVTTPYLDRHNDHLQIYVKRQDGEFVLTDDGYIIGDLRACGCDLDAGSRNQLLQMALNGFGVQERDDALVVRATGGNFASRKHNLVQAMLAVDDLFCLAHPMVASLFREDVTAWLELHGVRYSTGIKIAGRSGLDHVFDFLITKSPRAPERLLRAISHPSPDMAKSLAFAWLDVCESRPPETRAYALLNDGERAPDPSVIEALERYRVRTVLWSAREEVTQELAA